MSSGGDEKKLTPAQIAYPSGPTSSGDEYVDYYVGKRQEQPQQEPVAQTPPKAVTEAAPAKKPKAAPPPPEPEPEAAPQAQAVPQPESRPVPASAEEPDQGEASPPRPAPSAGKSRGGLWLVLLVAVVAGGYLFKDQLTGGASPGASPTAQVAGSDIIIRVVSQPPAEVYRRQLLLGTTPLEVTRDEGGVDLRLQHPGYKNAAVSFEGATAGVVKEVSVVMEPVAGAIAQPAAAERPVKVAEEKPVATETPIVAETPAAAVTPVVAETPAAAETPVVAETPAAKPVAAEITPTPTKSPKPAASKPTAPSKPAPPRVSARPAPPPKARPAYRPPPRRYTPPPRPYTPPPRNSGGGGHRIQPPDF